MQNERRPITYRGVDLARVEDLEDLPQVLVRQLRSCDGRLVGLVLGQAEVHQVRLPLGVEQDDGVILDGLDQQAEDVKTSLLRERGQRGDDVCFCHDSIYMKPLRIHNS